MHFEAAIALENASVTSFAYNAIVFLIVLAAAAYLLYIVYLNNPQRLWERKIGELTKDDLSALYIRLSKDEWEFLNLRIRAAKVLPEEANRTVFEVVHTEYHFK